MKLVEGLMLNIEGGEIFTDQVFTDFDRRRLQLEPRKHVWGRLIGLQQAGIHASLGPLSLVPVRTTRSVDRPASAHESLTPGAWIDNQI